MPTYAYIVLALGWAVWVTPFILANRRKVVASKLDKRARWGIFLVGLAFFTVFQGKFWERPLPVWRPWISVPFLLIADFLAWNSVRTLGRQWRVDAGLNADHELVTSGAYRIVRHPIYTSILCILLGAGFLITPLPMLALATVLAILGTEIRVRIEDGLLASRFGDTFRQYQRSVPAYLPFLR